jgi:type IV secretion system protein VirB5
MKRIKARSKLAAVAAGVVMLCASAPARAGIPVIDVAGLIQAVMEVLNSVTQVANQYEQIEGMYKQIDGQAKQLESMSNARNLGDVLNNPALQNYVPRDAVSSVSRLESGGYGSLSGTARGLRDAQMVYNCMDVEAGAGRTQCQASLAKPYQQKAFMQDALDKAKDRAAQINGLMRRAGSTTDQKEIEEVNARIGAETALLQHEVSQIELMRGMAEADQRVAESRAREGQLQQASRARPLSDFLRD